MQTGGKSSSEPKVEQIRRIYVQQYLTELFQMFPESRRRSVRSNRRARQVFRRGLKRTMRDPIPSRGACLSCTRRRMQLVVMAAVLALAGAGQGCHPGGCRPINTIISVESCGTTQFVHTTICAGQCYHEDPVYISHYDWDEQRTCNGDWSYEVKHFSGCPVPVTYPVARNCECAACNAGNTYCGRLPGDITSCLPFK